MVLSANKLYIYTILCSINWYHCETIEPLHTPNISCSTLPQELPCFLTSAAPNVSNTIVNWGRHYPYDLRLFYFTKSIPRSDNLKILGHVRWRLPQTETFDFEIQGFQLDVTEVDNNTDRRTHRYLASLAFPISGTNRQMRNAEMFVKVDGYFEFGSSYKISVSLVPHGIGGKTQIIFSFPSWKAQNGSCDLSNEHRAQLAATWTSTFTAIEVIPRRSALNVSFITAPRILCIQHYIVRLEDINGATIKDAYISQVYNGEEVSHMFEEIPAEVTIVVKVTPNSTNGNRCVCSHCNCVTLSSRPFKMEKMFSEETSREVITFVLSEKSDMLWLFAILLLSAVFCSLILLTVVVIVYCTRSEHQYSLNIHQQFQQHKNHYVDEENLSTILLVDNCSIANECTMTNELAKALKASGANLRFCQWEKHAVEENVFRWVEDVLREADQIILVNGDNGQFIQNGYGLNGVNDELLASIKPNDSRVIHLQWHYSDNNLKSNLFETFYTLPRDAPLLCAAVQINFDTNHWKALMETYLRISTVPTRELHVNENAKPSEENCAQTLEIADRSVLLEDNNQSKTDTLCDSAYGSMNTGDVHSEI